MAKIAGIVGAVLFGVSLGAAAGPGDHRSHGQFQSRSTVVARPVVVAGYVPYYPSYPSYSSSRHSPFTGRSTTPPAYFVAMSPKSPAFSFNGSPPEPQWHWQRASLQDIDAEVRARKGESGRK